MRKDPHPQSDLPFGSILDHPENAHAHGNQTYCQKQSKQGIAGHESPDLAGEINQAVHAAHDGLHAGGDSRLRSNASYYNKFGQESRAASPAFPPSRA